MFGPKGQGFPLFVSMSEPNNITYHLSPSGVLLEKLAYNFNLAEAFAMFQGMFIVCLRSSSDSNSDADGTEGVA